MGLKLFVDQRVWGCSRVGWAMPYVRYPGFQFASRLTNLNGFRIHVASNEETQ
jgi:hypothetical protein